MPLKTDSYGCLITRDDLKSSAQLKCEIDDRDFAGQISHIPIRADLNGSGFEDMS
jgi:hypothetical protein